MIFSVYNNPLEINLYDTSAKTNGEVVSGSVVYQVDTPVSVVSIIVRLVGVITSGTETTIKEQREFLCLEYAAKPSSGNVNLGYNYKPGNYEYPFEFEFPHTNQLPPSFSMRTKRSQFVQIEYLVTCTVEKALRFKPDVEISKKVHFVPRNKHLQWSANAASKKKLTGLFKSPKPAANTASNGDMTLQLQPQQQACSNTMVIYSESRVSDNFDLSLVAKSHLKISEVYVHVELVVSTTNNKKHIETKHVTICQQKIQIHEQDTIHINKGLQLSIPLENDYFPRMSSSFDYLLLKRDYSLRVTVEIPQRHAQLVWEKPVVVLQSEPEAQLHTDCLPTYIASR